MLITGNQMITFGGGGRAVIGPHVLGVRVSMECEVLGHDKNGKG